MVLSFVDDYVNDAFQPSWAKPRLTKLRDYDPEVEAWRDELEDLMPTHLKRRPDAAVLLDKALYVNSWESGGNEKAVGDGGAAWGGFQSHHIPPGSDRKTQINDFWGMVANNPDSWTDWGENNSYQGKPFGALGVHPYSPDAKGGGGVATSSGSGSGSYVVGGKPSHVQEMATSVLEKVAAARVEREIKARALLGGEPSSLIRPPNTGGEGLAAPGGATGAFAGRVLGARDSASGGSGFAPGVTSGMGGGGNRDTADLGLGLTDKRVGRALLGGLGSAMDYAGEQPVADLIPGVSAVDAGRKALNATGLTDIGMPGPKLGDKVPGADWVANKVENVPSANLLGRAGIHSILGVELPDAGSVLAQAVPRTYLDVGLNAAGAKSVDEALLGFRLLSRTGGIHIPGTPRVGAAMYDGAVEAVKRSRALPEGAMGVVGDAASQQKRLSDAKAQYADLLAKGLNDEDIKAFPGGQDMLDLVHGGRPAVQATEAIPGLTSQQQTQAARNAYEVVLKDTGSVEMATQAAREAAAKEAEATTGLTSRARAMRARMAGDLPGASIVPGERPKTSWTISPSAAAEEGPSYKVETNAGPRSSSVEEAQATFASESQRARDLGDAAKSAKRTGIAQQAKSALQRLREARAGQAPNPVSPEDIAFGREPDIADQLARREGDDRAESAIARRRDALESAQARLEAAKSPVDRRGRAKDVKRAQKELDDTIELFTDESRQLKPVPSADEVMPLWKRKAAAMSVDELRQAVQNGLDYRAKLPERLAEAKRIGFGGEAEVQAMEAIGLKTQTIFEEELWRRTNGAEGLAPGRASGASGLPRRPIGGEGSVVAREARPAAEAAPTGPYTPGEPIAMVPDPKNPGEMAAKLDPKVYGRIDLEPALVDDATAFHSVENKDTIVEAKKTVFVHNADNLEELGGPVSKLVDPVPAGDLHWGAPKPPPIWKRETEAILTQEEILDAAKWYSEALELFAKAFRTSDPRKYLNAFLVSQVQQSVEKGVHNVFQGEDRVLFNRVHKSFAKTPQENAIMNALREFNSTEGISRKISDFIDSALGKKVRTWARNDARAGRPFVVDVWTGRDYGFIDEAAAKEIEKQTGKTLEELGLKRDFAYSDTVDPKTDELKRSGGGVAPSQVQYEAASAWGNDLTDALNAESWLGKSDWTPEQIQAIGWMKMKRAFGEDATKGTIQQGIREATHRIDIPNVASIAAARGVTLLPAEAEKVGKAFVESATGWVEENIPGARIDRIETPTGDVHLDVLSSHDTAADVAAAMAHLTGKDAASVRTLRSGTSAGYDIVADTALSADEYAEAFRVLEPLGRVVTPVKRGEDLVGWRIEGMEGTTTSGAAQALRDQRVSEALTGVLADRTLTKTTMNFDTILAQGGRNGEAAIEAITSRGRPDLAGALKGSSALQDQWFDDAVRANAPGSAPGAAARGAPGAGLGIAPSSAPVRAAGAAADAVPGGLEPSPGEASRLQRNRDLIGKDFPETDDEIRRVLLDEGNRLDALGVGGAIPDALAQGIAFAKRIGDPAAEIRRGLQQNIVPDDNKRRRKKVPVPTPDEEMRRTMRIAAEVLKEEALKEPGNVAAGAAAPSAGASLPGGLTAPPAASAPAPRPPNTGSGPVTTMLPTTPGSARAAPLPATGAIGAAPAAPAGPSPSRIPGVNQLRRTVAAVTDPNADRGILHNLMALPGVSQGLLTALDAGNILRQNQGLGWGDPRGWLAAAKGTFKAFGDPEFVKQTQQAMEASDLWGLIQGTTRQERADALQAALYAKGHGISADLQNVTSGGRKMVMYGDEVAAPGREGLDNTVMGRLASSLGYIEASGRAYNTGLNVQGFNTFEKIARPMIDAGITDLKAYEDVMHVINLARGHSGTKFAEALGKIHLFFSPQYMFSRPQLLNAARDGTLAPEARRLARKSVGGMIAGNIALLGTLGVTGSATGLWSVNADPTSSDFGQLKVGNTRIDTLAGYGPLIKTGARLLAKAGNATNLTDWNADDRKLWEDSVLDFMLNKTAPLPGIAARGLIKKQWPDPKEWQTYAKLVAPMISMDVLEAVANNIGANKLLGAPVAAISALGGGTNTYENAQDSMENTSKQVLGKPLEQATPVERLKVLDSVPEDNAKAAKRAEKLRFDEAAKQAGYVGPPKDKDGNPAEEDPDVAKARNAKNQQVYRDNPDLDVQRWYHSGKNTTSLNSKDAVDRAIELEAKDRKVTFTGADRNLMASEDDKKAWAKYGKVLQQVEYDIINDRQNLQTYAEFLYKGRKYAELTPKEQDAVQAKIREGARQNPKVEAIETFFGVKHPDANNEITIEAPVLAELQKIWAEFPKAKKTAKPGTKLLQKR